MLTDAFRFDCRLCLAWRQKDSTHGRALSLVLPWWGHPYHFLDPGLQHLGLVAVSGPFSRAHGNQGQVSPCYTQGYLERPDNSKITPFGKSLPTPW